MTPSARKPVQPTAGVGKRWTPPVLIDLDEESAGADPDDDSGHRGSKHGEQFADEQGVDRNRGRDDFDDLVRFLLDQLGHHHAGQEKGQEEEQHLPDLRGERSILGE